MIKNKNIANINNFRLSLDFSVIINVNFKLKQMYNSINIIPGF